MKRNPRILLVYPETPETYWSFRHALKFIGKKATMPPLGLLTVAAMLPREWEISFIDMNVSRLRTRDLAKADLVMLSAMMIQKRSFEAVVERCGRLGVPVAAGGPYPTSCHAEIKGVAHFILGEAETNLAEFAADFQNGCARPVYEEGPDKPDLSCTPVPRFDLLDVRAYNSMPLQFSRGCPFACEFCDIVHLFGHRPRTKPAASFLAELDAVLASGFRGGVFVVDDNFIGNRKNVKDLLRAVAAWQADHGHPFFFSTEASIDLAADEELLDLMQAVGFNMVFIGLETPAACSLQETRKVQNLSNDVASGVRAIQSRGIEVTGGFILGFDSDPPDIEARQIEFISDLAVPVAMVGLLQALPNTALHQRLNAEGRLLSHATGNNTHDTRLNFIPRRPLAQILAGYLRVLETVYAPRRYFRRCLEFLSRIRPSMPPRPGTQTARRRPILTMSNLLGLAGSLLRQSLSTYGLAYLAFLTKALVRHPAEIVRIFSLALEGHHFFVLTRKLSRSLRRSLVVR